LSASSIANGEIAEAQRDDVLVIQRVIIDPQKQSITDTQPVSQEEENAVNS
jgi:hypothetical protein